jgi:hypothetical protein
MPLDVDRLVDTVLAGTQALIAKALAPIRAENDGLRSLADSLQVRVIELEGRPIPALVTDRALTEVDAEIIKAEWAERHGEIYAKAELAIAAAEDARIAAQEALHERVAALEAREVPDVLPEPPDLSDFATKAEVEAVKAAAAQDHVQLAAYVKGAIEAIVIPEPIPGKDGVGIADAKKNDDGELIVKLTSGETFNVGKVRGEDGFGFEDMAVGWDGERTLTLTFTKDGRTEVTSLTLPAIIDRGVWREGRFERGDAVTWGGSLFIAQRDTDDKPETSDAWRLAVKRGRDAKPTK